MTEAEVSELHVPAGVQEDVVRLNVAMDNAPAVQIRKGQGELASVETRHRFLEVAIDTEKTGKVLT